MATAKIENWEENGVINNEQSLQERLQRNIHGGRGLQQEFGPVGFRGPNNHRSGRPFRRNRGGGDRFRDDFHGRRGGGPPQMVGRGGGPSNPNGRDDRSHGYSGGHFDKIAEKLSHLSGSSCDLQSVDTSEKMFAMRTRLYVGNIPHETTDNDLKEFFAKYGETRDYFINKDKNFAFVLFDYRVNAEKAKRELDGTLLKGNNVKIRFTPNGCTIKIKNLTPYVSNELLFMTFSIFGHVERACVIVDERGRSTGEGIVEFKRKSSAQNAVQRCSQTCLFLTASIRPCIVEHYEPTDDIDGLQDKYIFRKHIDFNRERSIGPRFGNPNNFETVYGNRWKSLYDQYAKKKAALENEFEMDKRNLEAQMDYAQSEHETDILREQLRSREMNSDRQKHEWEMMEKMVEEQRQQSQEQARRQQEALHNLIAKQDEDMRRRRLENNLYRQGCQQDNMPNQQGFEPPPNNCDWNLEGPSLMEPKAFMNSFKRNKQRFEGPGDMSPGGPQNGSGRDHWVNSDNRRDDFPPKRRRF